MSDANDKKPESGPPKKRVGFWKSYFAWFMAVMGADPGYRPWETQPDEEDRPPDDEKKD
jgi:hypothetical protein